MFGEKILVKNIKNIGQNECVCQRFSKAGQMKKKVYGGPELISSDLPNPLFSIQPKLDPDFLFSI